MAHPTEPVWPAPDDLAALPFGERLRRLRDSRGMTRDVLAGLSGISTTTIKRLESGEIPWPRLDVSVHMAAALHLPGVEALIHNAPEDAVPLTGRVQVDVVPLIRDAVMDTNLTVSDRAVVNPDELHHRTEHAWQVWHRSARPRTDAGRLLPGLVRDGRHAMRVLDGKPRRRVAAAMVGIYGLAEQVLAWVSDVALMTVVADRCMGAAELADQPEALALAAWVVGNARRSRDEEGVYRLAVDACALLAPSLTDGPDSSRALWGACQLHSAITASWMRREGDAMRGLDLAAELADRMPTGYIHGWTLFSSVNTKLTGLSVQVELHKSRGALDLASTIDPDTVPGVDRRARMLVESARASMQTKDYSGALLMLTRAADTSQESARCHPIPRGIARDLVLHGGALLARDARQLATRLNVAV
jgi:transcriptional regulator with XRE-family HTH domain